MKLSSTVALAVALALGATAISGSPAFAAKEKAEKPGKAPAAKLSPGFQKLAPAIQKAMQAKDYAAAGTAITAAEPAASAPDDKYFLGAMKLQLAQASKNIAGMRTGINEMISSGSSLATNMAELQLNSGKLAYELQDYKDAGTRFAEADRLGSKDINRLVLAAEAAFKLGRFPDTISFLDRAVAEQKASGQVAPENWYRRALSVSLNKTKNPADIAKWSRNMVAAYPTKENWRDALVIYRDSTKLDGQLQLDVYRLMRNASALAGERDFYEYAALATERALPGEAKAVIEEGYASGAVSRTSVPVRERLAEATAKLAADRASVTADEKRAPGAADGKLAANTGGAYLAYGDNAKALELFKLAQKKGGIDADAVNTRMGIALARSGMKAEARKAFEAVAAGQRKDIAQYWLLWLTLNP
jgi:tetratricopeptide (TPR) repeat protein